MGISSCQSNHGFLKDLRIGFNKQCVVKNTSKNDKDEF